MPVLLWPTSRPASVGGNRMVEMAVRLVKAALLSDGVLLWFEVSAWLFRNTKSLSYARSAP